MTLYLDHVDVEQGKDGVNVQVAWYVDQDGGRDLDREFELGETVPETIQI